jgi:pyridoxine 5'-phosphate synthase PdxJ
LAAETASVLFSHAGLAAQALQLGLKLRAGHGHRLYIV